MKKGKIILAILVITGLACILRINNINVQAAENCTTHTNYYLFTDASKLGSLINLDGKERTTSKSFNLGVPEEGKNVRKGRIDIINSDKMSEVAGIDSITKKDFFTISHHAKESGEIGEDNSTSFYCSAQNNNCFAVAIYWVEDGVESSKNYQVTKDYEEFKTHLDEEFSNAKFSKVNAGGTDYFTASVTRTWPDTAINKLKAKGLTDTDVVYSIAAYYVRYDVCESSVEPEPPVDKENQVTTHYYIENTTTKLHDDFIENNVPAGTYTSTCPETLKSGNKYYDRLKASVSIEMPEEGSKELICYYREQTYSMTINYGEDENCTSLLQDSVYKDGLKEGQAMSIDVPESIGKMTRPALGTYSSQIVNKPELNGTNLSFTMPAKDVSICIVYTPQTGSAMVKWLALIGLGALAFTIWNISKKNNEINNEA